MDELTAMSAGSAGTQPPHAVLPHSTRAALARTYAPPSPATMSAQQLAATTPLPAHTGAVRETESYGSSPDERTETLSIPAPAPRPRTAAVAPPKASPPRRPLATTTAGTATASGRWVLLPTSARSSTGSRSPSPAGRPGAGPSRAAATTTFAAPLSITRTPMETPPRTANAPSPPQQPFPALPPAHAAPDPSGARSTRAGPFITSEVGVLAATPEKQRGAPAVASPSSPPPQQQQSRASPSLQWYHPPPATQALPSALVPSPRPGGGGGAAALFDTASEAVSTLEQQYRATVKQLDMVQGMYMRLNEHNDGLGREFNALRGQLEQFKETVHFGLYNDVRRVRAEARALRQYVDLMFRDFGHYLEVMGREVTQGVQEAVSEVTGEGARLPYYRPNPAQTQATAASVAAARSGGGGPRGHYNPNAWLGAISPTSSNAFSQQRRLSDAEGREEDDDGVGDAMSALFPQASDASSSGTAAEEIRLLLAPPPADEGSVANDAPRYSESPLVPCATAVHAQQPMRRSDEASSSSITRQLAETRRQLVLAEGKLRVTEQDCERRVQQVKEAYGEREKTMRAELLVLRRALGLPTEDLGSEAAEDAGATAAQALVKSVQQSNTLPYRDSMSTHTQSSESGGPSMERRHGAAKRGGVPSSSQRNRADDDMLVNTFSSESSWTDDGTSAHERHAGQRPHRRHRESDDEDTLHDEHGREGRDEIASEDLWTVATTSEGANGSRGYDASARASSEGYISVREQYAPLLFNSSDSRAVEKKVRALMAQPRQHRGASYWEPEAPHRRSISPRRTRSTTPPSEVGEEAHQARHQSMSSHQRWKQPQNQRTHGPRRSPIHQCDRFSPARERQLESAAQRLLGLVEKEKMQRRQREEEHAKRPLRTAMGGNDSSRALVVVPSHSPSSGAGTLSRSQQQPPPTLAVGARRLPEQEAQEIRKQAHGKSIPSAQMMRPVAVSDVSKVAKGLWAEHLLAQRGTS